MNSSANPSSTDTARADIVAAGNIPMPRLSDDAVVQIHDFIHHVLDLFEARYGDQIHRFYADLCGDSLIDSDSGLNLDDPPF
ncbi:MAG: hypothetical protein Q8M01_17090 [Rubrivivax sp.]|nr:hypothetical protein [Rubrivivax sp.]